MNYIEDKDLQSSNMPKIGAFPDVNFAELELRHQNAMKLLSPNKQISNKTPNSKSKITNYFSPQPISKVSDIIQSEYIVDNMPIHFNDIKSNRYKMAEWLRWARNSWQELKKKNKEITLFKPPLKNKNNSKLDYEFKKGSSNTSGLVKKSSTPRKERANRLSKGFDSKPGPLIPFPVHSCTDIADYTNNSSFYQYQLLTIYDFTTNFLPSISPLFPYPDYFHFLSFQTFIDCIISTHRNILFETLLSSLLYIIFIEIHYYDDGYIINNMTWPYYLLQYLSYRRVGKSFQNTNFNEVETISNRNTINPSPPTLITPVPTPFNLNTNNNDYIDLTVNNNASATSNFTFQPIQAPTPSKNTNTIDLNNHNDNDITILDIPNNQEKNVHFKQEQHEDIRNQTRNIKKVDFSANNMQTLNALLNDPFNDVINHLEKFGDLCTLAFSRKVELLIFLQYHVIHSYSTHSYFDYCFDVRLNLLPETNKVSFYAHNEREAKNRKNRYKEVASWLNNLISKVEIQNGKVPARKNSASSSAELMYINTIASKGISEDIQQYKVREKELKQSLDRLSPNTPLVGIDKHNQYYFIIHNVLYICSTNPNRILFVHNRNSLQAILRYLDKKHPAESHIHHVISSSRLVWDSVESESQPLKLEGINFENLFFKKPLTPFQEEYLDKTGHGFYEPMLRASMNEELSSSDIIHCKVCCEILDQVKQFHCPLCHLTLDRHTKSTSRKKRQNEIENETKKKEDEEREKAHLKECEEKFSSISETQTDSLKKLSRLFCTLKRALFDIEASIPIEAVNTYYNEKIDFWIKKLKFSTTNEDLFFSITELLNFIKNDWIHKWFNKAAFIEDLKISFLKDATLAAFLFTLDAALIYTEAEYQEAQESNQDEDEILPEEKSEEEKIESPEEQGTGCLICEGYDSPETILLCDSCGGEYHMKCLTPPVLDIPPGKWLCPQCFKRRRKKRKNDIFKSFLHPAVAFPRMALFFGLPPEFENSIQDSEEESDADKEVIDIDEDEVFSENDSTSEEDSEDDNDDFTSEESDYSEEEYKNSKSKKSFRNNDNKTRNKRKNIVDEEESEILPKKSKRKTHNIISDSDGLSDKSDDETSDSSMDIEEQSLCNVCGNEPTSNNPLVICEGKFCKGLLAVHKTCYGIKTLPLGPFICDPCGEQVNPECPLCGKTFGAKKRTDLKNDPNFSYCHLNCAIFTPKLTITTEKQITNMNFIKRDLNFHSCKICGKKRGITVICQHPSCKTRFHVSCGMSEGRKIGYEISAEYAKGKRESFIITFCPEHSNKNIYENLN